MKDQISVGDSVAMLVPMTPRDIDGCCHMHWVEGEAIGVSSGYVVAKHATYEATYALDTGEQSNGSGKERGPSRIEPMTDDARVRVAEGALKKSNYERRDHVLSTLADIDIGRYTTEALERIAAYIAGEETIVGAA